MLNNCFHCKPPLPQQNIYNFVFGSREKRSISLKVDRLKQIAENQEIKQKFMQRLQMGKCSQNALKIIHMKLEKQNIRRQSLHSYDVKTEVCEEDRLPTIQTVKNRHIENNKENIILNKKRVRKKLRATNFKSDPTIEFSPWENDQINYDYEIY